MVLHLLTSSPSCSIKSCSQVGSINNTHFNQSGFKAGITTEIQYIDNYFRYICVWSGQCLAYVERQDGPYYQMCKQQNKCFIALQIIITDEDKKL